MSSCLPPNTIMKGLVAVLVVLQLLLMTPRQADARKCQCGKVSRQRSTREIQHHIVGPRAKETDVNEYPWQIGVVYKNDNKWNNGKKEPFCGGSIISRRYVLTAAHCFLLRDKRTDRPLMNTKIESKKIQILVGEHNTRDEEADRRDVIHIRNHPSHKLTSKSRTRYDFSILKLASPLTFSSRMSPICLPASTNSRYMGRWATVSGWGVKHWAGGSNSPKLMETTMKVVSNPRCNSRKFPELLCADGKGSATCSGDSGGPMSVSENGR